MIILVKNMNVVENPTRRWNKTKFNAIEESFKSLFHSLPQSYSYHSASRRSPLSQIVKESTQVILKVAKENGPRCTIRFLQQYGISVIPSKPKRPPYPQGYDLNAKCEYHWKLEDIPRKIV